jgi:DNA polymerase-3 subunit alpha
MPKKAKYHDHHCHSHYSVTDCVIKIPDLVKHSKKLGRQTVTLTDHGTLGGIYELGKECKSQGMKPIFGIECYYVDDYESEEANVNWNYAHVILLAKNAEGWQNIKDLQSKAWEEGYLKKPRISLKTLQEKSAGIICTSACLRGLVGWNYFTFADKYYGDESIKKRKDIIRKRVRKFHELFGDDFYLEMQLHDMFEQAKLNKYLMILAERFNIKLIIAGDCHYLNRNDYKIHDIMICYARKTLLAEPNNGTYSTHELYMKSDQKLKYAWEEYHSDYMPEKVLKEAIASTQEINEKIEEFPLKPDRVCLPEWENPNTEMKHWVECGWNDRLTETQRNSKVYNDRLDYEMKVFEELEMEAYMLVCADIIKRAIEEGIPIGPGRGSVCGSLVAYLMNISQIDPIRFGTSFDRFLISSRLSLPDIDMDFGKRGREKIKKIVENLYGEQNFAAIVTYGDWKPRGLIKDIGRVLGESFQEMNRITKRVSDKTKKFEDSDAPIDPEVKTWLRENPHIYNPAKRLQGVHRVKGVHASGMILTPSRLEDWTPIGYMVERDSEDKRPIKISEWDMYALEDLNILKIDFLGLQTLDVIYKTVKLINKKTDDKINDIWKTVLDDLENEMVYEMIADGHVMGLFQVETSEGMLELVKRMKPTCFHDLDLIISLYRTAVIQAGMTDEYLERREGKEFEYIHDIVEPVLKSTLGVMIYQEQLMGIAVVAGGFTPQESDNFRKGTKLKDPEKFKPWKDKFVEGCKKNGLSKMEANTLWDWCYKFSGYGFNRSHSAAYALITYATAWLKWYYPYEFMTALMTYNADDDKMLPKYFKECKRLKIKIRMADINKSTNEFRLVNIPKKQRSDIICPFKMIKGVGDKAIEAILAERQNGKFESLEDFFDRVDKRVVNIRVMTNLILCGAFRKLDGSVEEVYDKYIEIRGKEKEHRQFYCTSCKNRYAQTVKEDETEDAECPNCASTNIIFGTEKCKGKKFNRSYIDSEIFGFFTEDDPLKKYIELITKHDAEPIASMEDYEDDTVVVTAGRVKNIKKHIDKRGGKMAFLDIVDAESNISLVVFASAWEDKLEHEIRAGCCYIFKVVKNRDNLLFNDRGRLKSKIIRLGM